ncbi:alpha galactosidase precursor [Pyronema domesticum]|nr:alpha galactosidase precursor [Pyronema domesticum]
MITTTAVLTLALLSGSVSGLSTKDGSGRLPALGWNSWNAYRCDINEAKVLSAAKQIQTLGLQDAGYEYINIDDCWSIKDARDPTTQRIQPDLTKFPRGINGLVDELHGMGFKVGIYSDAGTKTCGGYPGSLYFEDIDAATFAEWGIDYLKYDNCNVPSSWPSDEYHNCHPDYNHPSGPNNTCIGDPKAAPPGYDWTTSNTFKRFKRMGDALAKQNRPILYSLCEWGQAAVETWGSQIAQSWRVTDDIFPYWAKVVHIITYSQHLLNSVDFFSHNDADMLDLGNGNLTLAESRTHFAIWNAMKSPILIGTDLAVLKPQFVDILRNKVLLQFSQDKDIGTPATPFKWDYTAPAEYWQGGFGNGERLVLMVNYADTTARKSVNWGEVKGTEKGRGYVVTDGWTGKSSCVKNTLSGDIEAHDTGVYVVGRRCH